MMAQPVPHQSTDKKRVKVYELRNNDWFDRGTGFCTAGFTSMDDGEIKEAKVIVESEDDPERLLLETKICKEDGFQKQQETLIVWTEPSNGVDMALSFQEPEGCALIWKFVQGVQQSFQGLGADDSLSDDLAMDLPASISLPAVELGNLQDIEQNVRVMSATAAGRDVLAKCIMGEDYIGRLIPLLEKAEDLESLQDLHRLCNIMKTIILLNDTGIIEHAVSDECILGVVGALEYDPDFPCHKANHRQWLAGPNRYKEVVPIEDVQVCRKIHQTYRLQYLKDVVLARILDDPTFSVLNSLIFFNQVDIVQHLQANVAFLSELFGIFKTQSHSQEQRKQAVLFIQQCCAIGKNLQPPARQTLYNNFIAHGLLQVINYGLRHDDVGVRVGATDILVSMIDHDPQMIRQTMYRQLSENQQPLTDSLIELLLAEADLGVKSQISDALKVLLDATPQMQPQEAFAKTTGEFPAVRSRPQPVPDPQHEIFLGRFYEGLSAARLFKPLLDLDDQRDVNFEPQEASMFTYLIEILCFFIRVHHHRSKFFVLQNNVAQRVTRLLDCPERYLRLVAIRFFRHLIGLGDEFYVKHLCEKQILSPILDVLVEQMPRNNLLSSACLEFFDFIKKENIKELVKYVVQNHREKLISLSYVETFRVLILRYDHTQGFTQMEIYADDGLDDAAREQERRPLQFTRALMEQLPMDPTDEEYWNTSDDEEEQAKAAEKAPATNGATPTAKPLVDYPSDEEVDENADPEATAAAADDEKAPPKEGEVAAEQPVPEPVQVVATPPERISEKRRREEDDEDELGKLMQQSKRRNSSSAGSNASIASGGSARRKKSFPGATGGAGAPKKIAITISSAVKTGGSSRTDEES